jgi:hypothetical protein
MFAPALAVTRGFPDTRPAMVPSTPADPRDTVAAGSRPLGPVTRRLIYALVLIPIVPSASFIGVVFCETRLTVAPFDDIRLFNLLFSVLWVAATVLIWRSVIVWTLGRRWLTALVGLIPFVQVVYAQPLWHTGGCFSSITDGMLRLGQHEVGIGLWVWLAIWVWWGWEKRQMSRADSDTVGAVRMSPTARRIVASIGSIPVVVGAFFITTVFLEDVVGLTGDPVPEVFTVTAVVAVLLWVLIWRRAARWSAVVIRHTVISVFGLLALPIIVQWLWFEAVTDDLLEVLLVMSPIIGWGVWMAVTVRLWPARTAALPAGDVGPYCLKCGYLLKGLSATRCPECGDEPTLDELWEANLGAV